MTLTRRSLLTLTTSLAALAATGVWADTTAPAARSEERRVGKECW